MHVLGIESSCDETACAIVHKGKTILSNVIASQIDLHQIFGGVVPELACRRHVDVMIPTVEEALRQAEMSVEQIDVIAVAHGPGLVGALMLGLNTAKALALALNKPLVAVNHIEAHLYAALMSAPQDTQFPCLGVVLSGGHSSIVLIRSIGEYSAIAETVDDAIGEAFDKAAKILGLPYPGGPAIEELAKEGDPHKHTFKAGKVKKNPLNFSFSGLKTAVLYAAKGQNGKSERSDDLSKQEKADIAASFQYTAFNDVIKKILTAAEAHNCKTIALGGGVTSSQTLRSMLQKAMPNHHILWPAAGLSLDNAAMIAGLGYHCYRQNPAGDSMELEPKTRITDWGKIYTFRK